MCRHTWDQTQAHFGRTQMQAFYNGFAYSVLAGRFGECKLYVFCFMCWRIEEMHHGQQVCLVSGEYTEVGEKIGG
jgi:hypothetical protein